jgi:cytochrome b6-f complex iron-sulfur subunit
MKRKEFITGLGSIGIGIACASLLNACSSKKDESTPAANNGTSPGSVDFTVDLDDPANAALKTAGGSVIKSIPDNSILIINMGNNVFHALSRICSHASCLVNYDSNNQKLPCPCHGSKFDLNGAVLNGPATRALTKYNTSLNGSLLHISG